MRVFLIEVIKLHAIFDSYNWRIYDGVWECSAQAKSYFEVRVPKLKFPNITLFLQNFLFIYKFWPNFRSRGLGLRFSIVCSQVLCSLFFIRNITRNSFYLYYIFSEAIKVTAFKKLLLLFLATLTILWPSVISHAPQIDQARKHIPSRLIDWISILISLIFPGTRFFVLPTEYLFF